MAPPSSSPPPPLTLTGACCSSDGHKFMHTPHLDAFAKESTLFTRAYVQYSFCPPSRNSFMSVAPPPPPPSRRFPAG